jgi:hypothetical protein
LRQFTGKKIPEGSQKLVRRYSGISLPEIDRFSIIFHSPDQKTGGTALTRDKFEQLKTPWTILLSCVWVFTPMVAYRLHPPKGAEAPILRLNGDKALMDDGI